MLGRVDFFVDSWHTIRLFENVKSTCKCDLLFPAGSEKVKRVKYLHKYSYSYRKRYGEFHHMEFNLGDSSECSTSFAPSSDRDGKDTLTRSIWLQINQILFRDYKSGRRHTSGITGFYFDLLFRFRLIYR